MFCDLDVPNILVNCIMEDYKSSERDSLNVLRDEGGNADLWKAAEEKKVRESLSLSYTERFKIMMRLMRIDNTLSRAKITHKKM